MFTRKGAAIKLILLFPNGAEGQINQQAEEDDRYEQKLMTISDWIALENNLISLEESNLSVSVSD